MEHVTSLEAALEQAQVNFKEARRLLTLAEQQHAKGEIGAERVESLHRLYDAAVAEVARTRAEA